MAWDCLQVKGTSSNNQAIYSIVVQQPVTGPVKLVGHTRLLPVAASGCL